ncbi:prolipoprotein diacylglyceryl transferase [Mucilaginibacter sp. FT3.2]|uniref:prolipoprotein diacylglyceryl transferase n=1 Tax=Mucilaginibacter sp. FT3.2 TaxID=2723090 RepID=UPI0016229428|nr:prolipoprotein diacylglyceryl transferase family protein [Mucilaginibacter sp. FT3.2]MBB6231932.1 phosphatidylglycerol:prolipoprotein diacylglycerol transferase [Mucilaginibacter sp. FT3.2]
MFPTIGHLVYYLFGVNFTFPVQTLGLFMALSFLFSYMVFSSEFKRYEALGKIQAFSRTVMIGQRASLAEISVNSLLGFLLGFKAFGAMFNYTIFGANPQAYLLSIQGNLVMGILTGAVFGLWVYADKKEKELEHPKLTEETVHPYQLMGLLVFSLGFFGFIGAKLFDTVEHWNNFRYNPVGTLFNVHGFSYYGGLIFGALTYLYICHKKGMKLVHLADIGSPGMMLAYGIGRIGCQLSGDGDWGIVNNFAKPGFLPQWMWAFKYPHNAINAGIPLPDCTGDYCNQLVQGVYPTPFYEATICLLFFALMWTYRSRIITPGFMFFLYLVLNGGERFLIEQIRINPKYNILGVMFTQASFIGLLMVLGGLIGFASLAINHKNNLQSRQHAV